MTPFTPLGATVSVSATGSTGNVAITAAALGQGGTEVRVYNAGSATVFIAFGASSSVQAAVTDMPVPPGAIEVFNVGPAITHMAAITASGTATVYATPGRGA